MSQDNQTTKTSSKEKTATTKDTEKEAKVIHNVFIDTLEKPISPSLSRPIIDTSSSEKHPDSTVKNLAGLNRRRFMQGFGFISMTALSAASLGLAGCGSDSDERSYIVDETVSFDHGVASGDPLSDRIILWTRVTPRTSGSRQFTVQWLIARDDQMSEIVKQGEIATSAVKDYTVKVDVDGLKPNTVYYYQFKVGNQTSRVGRTKTLPVGQVDKVKLAVFSCANYPAGFFHVYADAAKRDDLDVFVHLGDYIYEYGRTTTDLQGNVIPAYASANAAAIHREVEPEQEVVSINEYRTRYAQYKTDLDLQDLHAAVPMIAVWDDHELANDTYENGAENHQPALEGSWDDRKLAAITAYHEWMPIRNKVQSEVYRRFDFGDLLSLHMLDTRVIGRDEQLNYANFIKADATGNAYIDAAAFTVATNNPERQLLGLRQSNWLVNQMQQSKATWQMLGQQILMGRMNIPAPVILNLADPRLGLSIDAYLALVNKAQTNPQALTAEEQAILAQPAIPYNTDAWDGYGAARELVLTAAKSLNKNLVVLAGDTHNAWANNLTTADGEPVGVEFATSSVSSPGFEEYLPEVPPATLQAVLIQLIDGLEYMNPNQRGYMAITVTPESCQSEWIFVSDILMPTYSSAVEQTLTVVAGENRISA
ncbi:alkaline phosphatase [uncultured Psychrobacter sp.]|uniref:alkaline phosphatase D family protein n=1 Tax=uncultured Psychrobacter sp. TaxID=259303 RepID=UPI00345A0764